MNDSLTYRFSAFELRPRERTLLQDGKATAVNPRAFDLLVVLVECAGNLVTKDELMERVWPRLVVEENNLQVQVSALRKVLGPDAIATVSGRGYRFAHAVTLDGGDALPPAPAEGVPQPGTSFVGRATELREIEGQLENARLVTLVGAGGIGKTRLAIEVSSTLAERFADGVTFVELAPLEDPRSVVGAIASALGVAADPRRSLVDSLLQHLAHRTQLVVLDNCEHLLGASASIATQLLRSCKGVKLLATSRGALRIPSETVYQVPTLPSPHVTGDLAPEALRNFPSVALFVDRASALDRGFAITPDNAADIAGICRKVDGIPLAIELAASRVRVMSVKTIAEHLSEQFRLLVGGDRSALPRQHTMRATIEWSYRLLSEPERSLFRRLSVFAGGFEFDAAEVVGTGKDVGAGDVLYLLAELVDKSLVAFEPRMNRYRMLEPVRQYALERLAEAGEEQDARDAHLRFHVTFSQEVAPVIRGERQGEFLARIVAERDNFAVAFAHARDKAEGGPDGLAMVFPILIGLSNTGHLDLARRLAREALAHAGAQGDGIARCRATYVTAWNEFWAGRYDDAYAMSAESVQMARRCGDLRVLGEALYRLGNAALALGKPAEARACFEEQLACATQAGDRKVAGDAHGGLGELDVAEGDFEAAQRHGVESMKLNPDELDSVVTTSFNLSRNAALLGAEDDALDYLRRAFALAGDTRATAYTQAGLCLSAWMALRRHDWQLALRLFGAASAHRDRLGYHNTEPDRSLYEHASIEAREAAGPAADDAFAAGVALQEEAALAEAKAWLATLTVT